MNDLMRLKTRRVIFVAEMELENMKIAIDALKKIIAMNVECEPISLDIIDTAISKMPEFSEDLTCDLRKIRELLEAEIEDPHCNGCGLTATVAIEGGQGEQRGCKCDPQSEEDAIDDELAMAMDAEHGAADYIQYQRECR